MYEGCRCDGQFSASSTDGVALRALVDRLIAVGGGDSPGAIAEQRDRRDVLIHTRRYPAPERDVNHLGTQGIAAEHLAGVRAVLGHRLNVPAQIVGAAVDADVCGIIDAVYPDRHAGLAAQRVDERVADCANAGWFLPAASENHLGTGACRRCRSESTQSSKRASLPGQSPMPPRVGRPPPACGPGARPVSLTARECATATV